MPGPLKMQVEELGNAVDKLNDRDKAFALSLCSQFWRRGLSAKQEAWVVKLLARATQPPQTAVNVGQMNGLLALFDKAKQHLKYPAIALSVPAAGMSIRVNVAGDKARFPGSLNVTTLEKGNDGRRGWLGRVHRDGRFEASEVLGNSPNTASVTQRLADLAADPVKVAAEHGRLTGHCCFCNLPLKDERSTGVGYGPVCAVHFGLPWGDLPASFGEAA